MAGLVVSGVGVGLAAPVLISAALAAVPRPRSGMASGAINTFRQVGYALGIAAFGSLFASRIGPTIAAGHPAAGSHAIHAAYATAQNDIYLVAGLAAVACGLLAMALIRPDRTPAPAAAPAGAEPAAPGRPGMSEVAPTVRS
jgi:MFS family permease